jgi:ABC-2 type transport system ATP-binding protein
VTEPAPATKLEAIGLSRWYGSVIALNAVNFEVGPGITALVGPNGAGKSSLIKTLTGEIRPSQGRVRVLGEDPWNNPELFRRIGYCPEQDALYEDMLAPDWVAFFMRLRGYEPADADEMAREALRQVALDEEAWTRKVGGFSKGMRQRVRLATAIAHRPDMLFLDEPLTGLDPVGRRELRLLFRRLAAEGTTILISSHVLHEVEATTDQILLLHKSRLIATGEVSEIRDLIDQHPHGIEVVCDRPRDLAAAMVGLEAVESVRIVDGKRLVAETRLPHEVYPKLVRMVVEGNHRVERLFSPDDNLEAVFKYLVQ